MKRLLVVLIVTLAFAVPSFSAVADTEATPEQAKSLVLKAAEYFKEHGRAAALTEFSNPSGQFVKGELYLFVLDQKGIMVAHGANQKLIGKDLTMLKDGKGNYFVKQLIEGALANNGGAWVDYEWTNPVTKKVEPKTSFAVKVGDVTIGCGTYRKN